MKVKCISLVNDVTGEPQESSPWITLGKIYTVLELYLGSEERKPQYRLISDDAGSPTLNYSNNFEVISGFIPSSWAVNSVSPDIFEISPSRWQESGYWEAYFDGEPWAETVFEEEVSKMFNEEQGFLAQDPSASSISSMQKLRNYGDKLR